MREREEIIEYLELTKSMVSECIRIVRCAGLCNDLVFLDWEDEINRLSVLDHNKEL